MLRSPCCVRYEQDDHADRPQVPAIVRLGRFCAPVPSPRGAALTHRANAGTRAGCAHDSGHERRRLPPAPDSVPSQRVEPHSLPDHAWGSRPGAVRDKEQGDLADVRQTVRRPPTAAATAIRADGCGLRRAAAPRAPRSQTPANGPELRKQSLKLGVPDPRESKTAWRCPRQRSRPLGADGPGTPNGVGARTGPPGLSCSRLAHGGPLAGVCDGPGRRPVGKRPMPWSTRSPWIGKSTHRNGPQMTHRPTAPGGTPLLAVRLSGR
jgi:hypothetical protein